MMKKNLKSMCAVLLGGGNMEFAFLPVLSC